MFVLVPTATELMTGLGKTTLHSLVVGISGDNGKTWRFVTGDPAAIRKNLPDLLPEDMKLPSLPYPAHLEPDRAPRK
jgi:hypothetical protein